MDRDQAFAAVAAALRGIAPEADLATVDPAAELADELDLDSMDMLELYAALAERTGADLGDQGDLTDEQRAHRSTLEGIVGALTSS